ncbi:MAG TPA: FHA domain-containing protein [Gemmatimonadaceae bacterium]|nr:FHA domain-containing protein [Gemmatimonadaceae bacterium]
MMRSSRATTVRRALLLAALALVALAPTSAGAQGIFFWKKKKPPPPPPPAAAAAPAAQAPPVTPPNALSPTQQADKDRLMKQAREKGLNRDTTEANAEERAELFKMVLIIDGSDTEARMGFDQAQKDIDAAHARDAAAQKSKEDAVAAKRYKLRAAETALDAGDLKTAESQVDDVLSTSPDDPRATSLKAAIADKRKSAATRKKMLILGAIILAVAVAGTLLLLQLLRAKREHDKQAKAEAAARKAILKVVDGIGRGKLIALDKDVFRIGAAMGAKPEEQNDLVLSDSDSAISRYHCSIIKKDGGFWLVDSSLNGTSLNDQRLDRGEDHNLEDGDEFVLADVTRIKFLFT